MDSDASDGAEEEVVAKPFNILVDVDDEASLLASGRDYLDRACTCRTSYMTFICIEEYACLPAGPSHPSPDDVKCFTGSSQHVYSAGVQVQNPLVPPLCLIIGGRAHMCRNYLSVLFCPCGPSSRALVWPIYHQSHNIMLFVYSV